jgi:hypothetical protein
MSAAEPLNPRDRDAFLRAVATMLRGEGELGHGVVSRIRRELQREFLRSMPTIDGNELRAVGGTRGRGKYR